LVAGLPKAGFKATYPHGQPAFVLYVRTFGDLVTVNSHIHARVADGMFLASDTFRVLPPLPKGGDVVVCRNSETRRIKRRCDAESNVCI